MSEYTTVFGSLDDYEKGRVIVIDDDPKAYVFSNVFEVANASKPYEKVAVGKNLEYVLEVIRCEDERMAGHTARRVRVVMDGTVVIELLDPMRNSSTRRRRGRSVEGEPAEEDGGVRNADGHRTLPAGKCSGALRRRRRDPAADDRGPGHDLSLGRHLPDRLRAR